MGRILVHSATGPENATRAALALLVARTAVAPAEIPIGVITAFVGAPFFLIALRRTGRRVA